MSLKQVPVLFRGRITFGHPLHGMFVNSKHSDIYIDEVQVIWTKAPCENNILLCESVNKFLYQIYIVKVMFT